MRYALVAAVLAGLFCIGCNQKKQPTAQKPRVYPKPGRTIEPLGPAGPETIASEPIGPAPMTAPMTPTPPAERTPLAPPEPIPAPRSNRVLAPMTPPTIASPPPAISPEPAPAATPPPMTTGGTYTIQKGDTFIGIARKIYGNASMMHAIMAANPGVNPRKLLVGQVINLPDASR